MTNDEQIAAQIVRELVRGFAAAGCELQAAAYGDDLTEKTTDPDVIAAEIGACDQVTLRVYRDGRRLGSVLLIEGNGGDVISDGSSRLWDDFPAVFAAADQISDAFAEGLQ